jgi:diadenosine tetraphosphate (Ap4A) HIT family hydrolase
MNDFKLADRLKQDTIELADWPLCKVLLMNDAQYPWCILVPKVMSGGEPVREIYSLDASQQAQLNLESVFLSQAMMDVFEGEKMNTAALGNVVSQLHIHHIVRFTSDKAWPAPVWGKFDAQPYSDHAVADVLKKLLPVLMKFSER